MAAIFDFRMKRFYLFLIYKATLVPSWTSDQNDFSYFDRQVTPSLPTKFRVNWLFGSGEEAQNIFSRWWPSWISDRNVFIYF